MGYEALGKVFRNKKVLAITLVSIFILSLILSGWRYSVALKNRESYTIIDFDEAQCYVDAKTLLDMGETFSGIKAGRLTGTEAEHNCAQYILHQFQNAGLSNAHIEEYPVLMFYPKKADISLVPYVFNGPLDIGVPSPLGSEIRFNHITDFVIQGYSGSLHWNNFRDDLEIVNIGDGQDESDYNDIGGKAVLVRGTGDQSGAPANSELFFKAWEHGAKAIILQNLQYGSEHGCLPIFKSSPLPESWPTNNYPDIPFFMVSKDVGDQIAKEMADHKIKIDFDIPITEVYLNVVVGDIKGKTDELIIMGAHHDTTYNAPGAQDNTVGTATISGLAKSLRGYKPKRTIRLCTFGGEEEGLFGSIFYFNAHQDEFKEKCKYMFNFDMDNVYLNRSNVLPIQFSCNSTKRIAEEVSSIVLEENRYDKYNVQFSYSSLLTAGSDQQIFAKNNIPVSCTWGSGCAEYHTYLDGLEYLNPESQGLAARIVGSTALYLANM